MAPPAALNLRVVPPLISKSAWSAPPVTAKVTLSPESASLAASVMTFWTFSAIVFVALEVNAGVSSLRSCRLTVTVIVSSADPETPSETVSMTTQELSPPHIPAS